MTSRGGANHASIGNKCLGLDESTSGIPLASGRFSCQTGECMVVSDCWSNLLSATRACSGSFGRTIKGVSRTIGSTLTLGVTFCISRASGIGITKDLCNHARIWFSIRSIVIGRCLEVSSLVGPLCGGWNGTKFAIQPGS